MLSPREYYALQDVQQTGTRLWAIGLATMVNTQLGGDQVPFLAEDFLGTGNRKQREWDKQRSEMAAHRLNQQLAKIKPLRKGDPEPEGLPVWARRDFGMSKPEAPSG